MEIDPSDAETEALRRKSETLKTLTTGQISSSISKLSTSSRALPSEKDFHFYYNFPEFKSPIDEIGAKSHSMLRQIGATKRLFGGKEIAFPEDVEDDSCDWLVNVNDEVLERFDVSCDEFSRLRKADEDAARARRVVDSDGFQLVCGRKKKGVIGSVKENEEDTVVSPTVRVVERDKKTVGPKPKVPFHIPSIRRPQEEYNILVNNSNQPFQHVWLERSEDGEQFVHPLEKLPVSDFVDTNVESLEPLEPPPLESTPFTMVVDVKELKEMAAKLSSVNEFAVDLEHNQYRSFQGLTCLMQISTRTEDFVVDTLKLRIHVGPYLREVFKDPTKKKVMHGADRDIAWLQRDFGIYVCNLFDTGQASRVLQMERFSLEHLLKHFCGVAANKEYQNADWRLRPLPSEMLKYAREDTHYLLYIYDLMRKRLLSESTDPENSLLLEVYKRSYDLCMQLYEKELLTDTSYLYIYGVQGANLNAKQLAVVAGLCEWRDAIARQEDESTGYILPNKLLLEIAKQMPLTTGNLRRLLKSKHPYVERSLGSVVNIIRHSVQNASSFEAVAEQLKEGHIQGVPELTAAEEDFPELQTAGDGSEGYSGSQHDNLLSPSQSKADTINFAGNEFEHTKTGIRGVYGVNGYTGINYSVNSGKVAEATVQVLKKPSRGFGALLGSSASKKNKGEAKLEAVNSSISLPFYSFWQKDQPLKQVPKQAFEEPKRTSETSLPGSCIESTSGSKSEDIILLEGKASEAPRSQAGRAQPESSSDLGEIILLDSDSDGEPADELAAENDDHVNKNNDVVVSEPELVVLDDDDDEEEEPPTLSDLSSSFQKCLQPGSEDQTSNQDGPEETGGVHIKPFDYEAARKQVVFGEGAEKKSNIGDDEKESGKKKSVGSGKSKQDDVLLPQGKRRQAFPASGNRSVTFR